MSEPRFRLPQNWDHCIYMGPADSHGVKVDLFYNPRARTVRMVPNGHYNDMFYFELLNPRTPRSLSLQHFVLGVHIGSKRAAAKGFR